MDAKKFTLVKNLDDYLSGLKIGDSCGKWKFIGITTVRYSTPGGPWKKPAYHFKKGSRDLVLSAEYAKGDHLYIVIESITRKSQTSNYDFDKYTLFNDKQLSAPDNKIMTYGTWGRLKTVALESLFQQVGFKPPYIITSQTLADISFEQLANDFLNWGEVRDKCKDIIAADPIGFFGYTKDLLPEVKIKNKGNIAPPDEEKKKAIEKMAVEHARKYLNEEGFLKIDSREHERGVGYDLLASNHTNSPNKEWHVEVKGTSCKTARFFLSRNEYNVAEKDKCWRLIVVTNALGTRPKLKFLTWKEVNNQFDMEPLSWYAELMK